MKIDVIHNRDGYDEYDQIAFDYDKPFLIEFIQNIKKNIGIFPRINETLVLSIAGEDVDVYHVKSIEYYEFMILFVLDEDKAIEAYR